MYGKLTVICGPMFAGKTTELLKRILWARSGESKAVLVLKTAFDNRYAETKIKSHDGLSVDAIAINQFSDVNHLIDDAEMVCLDEIQFFTMDSIEFIRGLLAKGKDVVVTGLDMNWKGNAFAATGTLMAMADETIKLQAICCVCGKPAYKTYKKGGGSTEIQLGHSDIYEPRCNEHWHIDEK